MPAPSRTTPARPSISPLSSPSKTFKSSPVATRDSTIHDVDAQLNSEMGLDADLGDDDRSSSLSEPDDDDLEDEEMEDEEMDDEEPEPERTLEVDSEAETERLDQTPKAQRRRDEALGRTPSKLSQAATIDDDELSDPPSPLPVGAGAASSTSTAATTHLGQKRKRSDTADSPLTSAESDIGESPRKRSHGMTHDVAIEDDTAPSTETAEQADHLSLSGATKKIGKGGRKGKRKGAKKVDEPAPGDELEEAAETVEEQQDQDMDGAPEDSGPKTEEDLAAKAEASGLYEAVAKQFLAFRKRQTNENLAEVAAELAILSQPTPPHPEYLRCIASVDARLQKQLREAHAYHRYRLQCLRDRALGDRAQLHSQYFQDIREVREDVLYKLGEDWYAIQRERRSGPESEENKNIYTFPKDKTERLKQQAKWNQEVSILSGVAKYVGFPAAPELAGVESRDADEDLKAMKLTKRTPAPVPQPASRLHYLPANPSLPPHSERLAHDQFIEQHAWARPPSTHQHPITGGVPGPGISHTPDWAAEPASNNLGVSGSNASAIAAAEARTAAAQVEARNLLRDLSGRVFKESIGGASPAARMGGSFVGSSPLGSVVKARKEAGYEAGGWRDFSGASTVSAGDGSTIQQQGQQQQPQHSQQQTVDDAGPRPFDQRWAEPYPQHSQQRPPNPDESTRYPRLESGGPLHRHASSPQPPGHEFRPHQEERSYNSVPAAGSGGT